MEYKNVVTTMEFVPAGTPFEFYIGKNEFIRKETEEDGYLADHPSFLSEDEVTTIFIPQRLLYDADEAWRTYEANDEWENFIEDTKVEID